MSICRDLDDTANLRHDSGRFHDPAPFRLDDTARMRQLASARNYRERGGMHPFAEGIIRFFRARTILEGTPGSGRWQRAWRYLERVEPHYLPPATRKAFFELTYLMQQQVGGDGFDSAQFLAGVRAIAAELDTFVEHLNAGLDN
jgi:hypothetical protein